MFTNNDDPEEEGQEEEAHIMGPTGEKEHPLMGLVGDITEAAAQALHMSDTDASTLRLCYCWPLAPPASATWRRTHV